MFARPFVLAAVAAMALPAAPAAVDFAREVRPVLSDNCFACHGPDEKNRMANLRLDTREGALSKVKPGDAASSPLFQRITHEKPALRMPPIATKRTLTGKQIDAIRRWINEGAAWKTHWSYSAPVRPDPPPVRAAAWVRNPVDRFVLARLEKEGLRPSPEAEKSTLLRRVTFDLTGLPPTPEEQDAFLADKSPQAYEKLVDRLLRSPHYGEKLAMQWLDLARYADTHGYHIDSHRVMWPWRDWVIRAFNDNMPFDRFTVEQLAGDLLPGATPSQRLATAFNRNHMINFEGGAIPEEYQTEYVMDRVETTANVFMGMSMGCARCHDHKYDPISQRDFYRFFAFFNTVDEKGLDGQRGNARPRMVVASDGQITEMDAMDGEIETRQLFLGAAGARQAQAEWEKTLPASAPLQTRLARGLLAHYEFEGNLADSSGNYRYARQGANDVNYGGGTAGRGATLTVDESIELDRTLLADPSRPFTLALFVRPTHERKVRLLDKLESGKGIEIYSGVSEYVPYYKRGAALDLVFGGLRLRTRGPVLFTVFSHLALLYDGSRAASGFRLYVNGEPMPLDVIAAGPAGFGNTAAAVIREFQGALDDLRVYDRLLNADEIAQLALHLPALRTAEVPAAKRSREERDRLREYFLTHAAPEPYRGAFASLRKLERERQHLQEVTPNAMVMAEMTETPLRESHVLARGDYRNQGEKVTAAVPAALPPLPAGAPANRLGLARWLTDPSHPLMARVTVNRFWQAYFGHGIVKTSEDFGSQGEAPSHPELLDWLATEFTRNNWDVRAMQKLIVMSATYRQSAVVSPELRERDPENRLLARMSRFRFPAEVVRDNALAVSGLLNRDIGGPSVFPYQPAGLWDELAFGREFTAQKYTPSSGRDLYRRSMYTFWKRTVPPAALSTFDAPDREKCTSRRSITNTPLQALVLMNDPTYVEAARNLATRMIREAGSRPDLRIAYAYRHVLARKPAPRELSVLRDAAAQQAAVYDRNPEAARKLLLAAGESPAGTAIAPAELAAWTNVATMILNLDEAISKE